MFGIPLPLIGLAALALALGVQTLRLSWAQDDLHEEQLAFSTFKEGLARETLRITREAAEKSREQLNQLTEEVKTIGALGVATKTEIRYVQSSGGPCVTDPVYRATIDGVSRVLDGGAGRDQGPAGRKPAPPVR
jgi:hypothetical protein